MAEKNISVDIVDVDPAHPPEDLIDLNPYSSTPTLVDRDLVLYDSRVIMEYLDERFPHPPLLPPDPVNRARFRLALARIESDWYSLLTQLETASGKAVAEARKTLAESLTASASVFAAKPFFLSDEMTLADCSLAPLLWRLPFYAIELPASASTVRKYASRLFDRAAFKRSLSAVERDLAGIHIE